MAKLNTANGSDPTPIADTIADADALLSGFAGKLPYQVGPSSATGQAMVHDAGILDQYNSGALTPTCDAAASVLVDSTALLLGQLETMAACSGDGVPLGLRRRLARTRRLVVRASTRTGQPAQVLLRRAASRLQEAARIAARAADAGEVSAECAGALDGVLVHLGGRAGS